MTRRLICQAKQSKEEMFDSIIKNAIDFLDSSFELLENRPKNSIVDFYSAIELFLKARLMHEHWTLIISKPELASLDNFQVGDFHSVFLSQAVDRIKNILKEPLPNKAIEVFKALGEHRNQIVHFAHTDYRDIDATKTQVVIEQWIAWHYLHDLITVNWSSIFKNYLNDIARVHSRMMKQRSFIHARFQEISPQIEIKKLSGHTIELCIHCEELAAVLGKKYEWGTEAECMVCNEKNLFIKKTNATVPCQSCNKEFIFFDKNLTNCPNCDERIDKNYLIEACQNIYVNGDDWCEEEGRPWVAYCHNCDIETPSVFFIDGLWSCTNCFDRGWNAISCPNCNEFVTGDMEQIKYFACVKCEDDVRARYLK